MIHPDIIDDLRHDIKKALVNRDEEEIYAQTTYILSLVYEKLFYPRRGEYNQIEIVAPSLLTEAHVDYLNLWLDRINENAEAEWEAEFDEWLRMITEKS